MADDYVPSSWQHDLEDRKNEMLAQPKKNRRPWLPVLILLVGAGVAAFILLAPGSDPSTTTGSASVTSGSASAPTTTRTAGPPRTTSTAPVDSDASARPASTLDPVSGSVPGATGIEVCDLLTADEITTALGDRASAANPGRRDGLFDPFGHCLWGLDKATNVAVSVFTEQGVRVVEAEDYALAAFFEDVAAGAVHLDGLGPDAWLKDHEVFVRVDDAALIVSLPATSMTATLDQGLVRLARLAAPRLAQAARNPAPSLPPPAKTPSQHGAGSAVSVGDCYDTWEAHHGGGARRTFGDCNAAHGAEVAAVADIGGAFPTYPDPQQQRRLIADQCPVAAAAYLGGPPPDGVTVLGAVSSENLWSQGGTRLECVLVHAPRTGSLRPGS